MSGYILSILGIVVIGIIIDIIVPSGTINKYIKSIYSIFVVAVIITPIINFISYGKNISFNYSNYELNEKLLNYIHTKQVNQTETDIENELNYKGLKNIDIVISFSINEEQLVYNSCTVNLEKLVIDSDNQHINKYDIIKEVVNKHTKISHEEIIINE